MIKAPLVNISVCTELANGLSTLQELLVNRPKVIQCPHMIVRFCGQSYQGSVRKAGRCLANAYESLLHKKRADAEASAHTSWHRVPPSSFERIAGGGTADQPAEGVDEEEVLGGRGEAFVAVAHVQVDHPVAGVRPDNREVASKNNVFQAHGEILRRE